LTAGKTAAVGRGCGQKQKAAASGKSGLETLCGIHRHPKNVQVADLLEAWSFCL
jgi:hypothetical protein